MLSSQLQGHLFLKFYTMSMDGQPQPQWMADLFGSLYFDILNPPQETYLNMASKPHLPLYPTDQDL